MKKIFCLLLTLSLLCMGVALADTEITTDGGTGFHHGDLHRAGAGDGLHGRHSRQRRHSPGRNFHHHADFRRGGFHVGIRQDP